MNRKLKIFFYSITTVIFFVTFITTKSFAQLPANNVSVNVSKTSLSGGKTIYQYTVVNNSSQRIVSFSLGSDYAHGVSELTSYPDSWSVDNGIKPGSILSPTKWDALVLTTEGSAAVEIQWSNNDPSGDILPGQTATGFAVTLQGQSNQYLNSHWTVVFGNATAASGLLTQIGLPRIALSLESILPQGSNMFNVKITVANNGSAVGNVTVSNIILKTLAGSGDVTLVSPSLPLTVGNVPAGGKTTISLLVNAPQGISKFSIAEQGSVNSNGVKFAFSGSQVAYTKQ